MKRLIPGWAEPTVKKLEVERLKCHPFHASDHHRWLAYVQRAIDDLVMAARRAELILSGEDGPFEDDRSED
jgi:hypothetical protein